MNLLLHGSLLAVVLMGQSSNYSNRGTIDFDVVVEELAQEGTWEQHEVTKFHWRPQAAKDPTWAPYRDGKWVYTDFGWTWKGRNENSWILNHYGHWTRHKTDGWVWVPEDFWLPSTVEWLSSGDYIGWRPSHLDQYSNYKEPEIQRRSDALAWNWIPLSKLGSNLTQKDFADEATSKKLLIASQPADHVFFGYKEIGRPGPKRESAYPEGKAPSMIPAVKSIPDVYYEAEGSEQDSFFIYRPRFFQDKFGIIRRVELFINPSEGDKKKEDMVEGVTGKKLEQIRKEREESLKKQDEESRREEKFMERLYE